MGVKESMVCKKAVEQAARCWPRAGAGHRGKGPGNGGGDHTASCLRSGVVCHQLPTFRGTRTGALPSQLSLHGKCRMVGTLPMESAVRVPPHSLIGHKWAGKEGWGKRSSTAQSTSSSRPPARTPAGSGPDRTHHFSACAGVERFSVLILGDPLVSK
jgi:hypothetical protein